jgi:polyribonucleotide nucleotidyltransferase
MLEAAAQEIDEKELERAIEFAQRKIQVLTGFFQHMANNLGIKKEPMKTKSEKIINDEWLAKKGNSYLGEILLTPNLS